MKEAARWSESSRDGTSRSFQRRRRKEPSFIYTDIYIYKRPHVCPISFLSHLITRVTRSVRKRSALRRAADNNCVSSAMELICAEIACGLVLKGTLSRVLFVAITVINARRKVDAACRSGLAEAALPG